MYALKGSCHCENITVDIELPQSPEAYSLRACDCDFCVKHGASYLSDPKGELSLEVRDEKLVGKYKQGSNTADFVFCSNCGVLIGVAHKTEAYTFMGINGRIIKGTHFKETVSVSPKELSREEKIKRWSEVWFRLTKKD